MRQWRSDQPPSLAAHPLASGLMPLSFLFISLNCLPLHPIILFSLWTCYSHVCPCASDVTMS